MRVFFDSEFIENGPKIPLQPISFGFVADDGRELYVINEECLSGVVRHPWLSVNVRPSLPISIEQETFGGSITQWDPLHPEYEHVLSMDALVSQVLAFLTGTPDLELWAYYGAYDHVIMAQLFGAMPDLPSGIPMFSHELMQLIEQHPQVQLPPQPTVTHHALWDARWNRDVFQLLNPETWDQLAESQKHGHGPLQSTPTDL